jgi:hypothetical protein
VCSPVDVVPSWRDGAISWLLGCPRPAMARIIGRQRAGRVGRAWRAPHTTSRSTAQNPGSEPPSVLGPLRPVSVPELRLAIVARAEASGCPSPPCPPPTALGRWLLLYFRGRAPTVLGRRARLSSTVEYQGGFGPRAAGTLPRKSRRRVARSAARGREPGHGQSGGLSVPGERPGLCPRPWSGRVSAVLGSLDGRKSGAAHISRSRTSATPEHGDWHGDRAHAIDCETVSAAPGDLRQAPAAPPPPAGRRRRRAAPGPRPRRCRCARGPTARTCA